MREYYARQRQAAGRVPYPDREEGVYSFAEIGAALGVTRQRAEAIYRTALRKLQRKVRLREWLR